MSDITIDENITIPEDTTLHIASWIDDETGEVTCRNVTIAEGVTVTVEDGGRLQVGGYSTLTNNGSIAGEGELIVCGTLVNNGSIDGVWIETWDDGRIIQGRCSLARTR